MLLPGGRSNASFWCSMDTQSTFHAPESHFWRVLYFWEGLTTCSFYWLLCCLEYGEANVLDTVKENRGKRSQSVVLEECFLCQNKHLLSSFKEQKIPQQNTPTLLKWGLWLLVYLKKIKHLMLPKQCRLSWLGKCCYSDTLIITIWYHDKSQYFGFLLGLVFMFSYNEAAFLNPGFLFSLKDWYPVAELP